MSEEKKVLLCEAGLKEGDTAWVQVVVGRDGGLFFPVHRLWDRYPVSSGQRAAHLSTPVRDITRAPVPREVVTVEYEVVPFSEMKAGDYHEAETGLHFIYHEDAVRLRRNHGHEHASKPPRVLRPIKKP
jgi:hypothetical protein